MNARMLAVASGLAAFASAGAFADNLTQDPHQDHHQDQQRDCMGDAMTYCSQHIFAPDRDAKIGYCLWQYRASISRECRSHLRPRKTMTSARPD